MRQRLDAKLQLSRATSRRRSAWCGALLLAVLACGCDDGEPSTRRLGDLPPSPNATLTPAPLLAHSRAPLKYPNVEPSSTRPSTKRQDTRRPTPPHPEPYAVHQAPTSAPLLSKSHTRAVIEAQLAWPDFHSALVPLAASKQRLREFREKTSRNLTIHLQSHGRMRIELEGRAFPVSSGTRVLARYENYGHLLLWPEQRDYRVLPPGTLAALMREGRADVTPLLNVDSEVRPAPDVLGRSARTWRFESKRGALELTQVEVIDAGFGGPLLCRFLLEWLSVAPTASACEENWVPVQAELRSSGGGRLSMTATRIDTRGESPTSQGISIPPQDARHLKYGLPAPQRMLSDVDASALRRSELTGTLTVHNNMSVPAYLLLDGTAVAYVGAHSSTTLSGVSRGQYEAALVDFFGAELIPRGPLALERTATLGQPISANDAGTAN